MSWKEHILKFCKDAQFFSGAKRHEIQKVEADLGVRLPEDLVTLLQESNGVEGQYGLGLIWPLDRIVRENKYFRENPDFATMYMPFDPLLFFADAGNGDLFAYTIQAGEIRRPDVFVWSHEEDSRTCCAPSLSMYLERWLSGELLL
ncbi:SMI1 / KNR4 family protein [Gimesia alba]|uniref:SMI1 / KNR4 family protein n=1 Tax=Gimesia alba TaxID=2527973 RepID=A0A517RQ12_9PLAN|nr:SMI1/KNR4 family protein [Gimesia alba]QDT45946.1 SMI1 / KNR4 family protein [Gimesia alba]